MCNRKKKFGRNMQGVCGHKLCICWCDIIFLVSASRYISWIDTGFSDQIDKNGLILPRHAFLVILCILLIHIWWYRFVQKLIHLKMPSTSTCQKLILTSNILFAYWYIDGEFSKKTLDVNIEKVTLLTMFLCKLHNFLIDKNE